MKIKALGFTSFEIANDNIVAVTDIDFPEKLGKKVSKVEADIAIYSRKEVEGKVVGSDKVTPKNKAKVFEITGAGEYEVGDMLVQRPIGMPYYIFDYGYTRIVYVGLDSKKADKSMFTDLGDVEVLILPVGDGDMFPDYEKIHDIIKEVEPSTLIPCGYMEKGIKGDLKLKTRDEFIHYFGYSNVTDEKTLKITGKQESEEPVMNVVFLS